MKKSRRLRQWIDNITRFGFDTREIKKSITRDMDESFDWYPLLENLKYFFHIYRGGL